MTNGFLEEHDKSKVTVYISHEYGGKWRNKRKMRIGLNCTRSKNADL